MIECNIYQNEGHVLVSEPDPHTQRRRGSSKLAYIIENRARGGIESTHSYV